MSRAVPSAPRRRRPLVIILTILLLLLLALGVVVALYVAGLARSVDDGVQRFDGQVMPDESLRPADPGSEAADGAAGAGGSVVSPTAPAPGQDPAQAGVQGPEAPAADEVADQGAVNFLLVGEDSGADARGETGRSDTLMWVHVPGDRQDVHVMSIMRDLWVPIPGHGDAKVNAAYQYGQIPLTVATVENMFQARVDHVVAVDMSGFRDLVDALGGVTVQNPRAFHSDHLGGHDFPAGAIQLDGEAALAFARERYNLPRGDYDRVENQQRLVKAIVSTLISRDTLSNPARVQETVDRFAPYLTFDDSLDSGALAGLAWSLRDVRGDDIQTSTVPNAGVGTTESGQSVVWPDWAGIREAGKGMRTGTLDEVGTP